MYCVTFLLNSHLERTYFLPRSQRLKTIDRHPQHTEATEAKKTAPKMTHPRNKQKQKDEEKRVERNRFRTEQNGI